jgi:hypothetical protein
MPINISQTPETSAQEEIRSATKRAESSDDDSGLAPTGPVTTAAQAVEDLYRRFGRKRSNNKRS